MRYTLDSNILINMERVYPRDIFATLWDLMEGLARQGEVCICEPVLRELARGAGGLDTWAKQLGCFVCQTQQDEVTQVAAISIAHPDWVRDRQNEADPWVIAHALKEHRIIVTEEKPKGPNTADRNQKIPNVAAENGAQTVNFFQFMKAQGWTF